MFIREQWCEADYESLRCRLFSLADEKYRDFHKGIVPKVEETNLVIGVRLPLLRQIAKEIGKGNARSFLSSAKNDYYEEVLLKALVIGDLKGDFREIAQYIADFVPLITNWAICDCFVSSLTIVKKQRREFYAFLDEYLHSDKEFFLRFAIVALMDYYLEPQYIDEVLAVFNSIHHEGYYVKMALAWGISVAYVKEKEKTMLFLRDNSLDDWTYNKALQKIIESKRVSAAEKEEIRSMKRK